MGPRAISTRPERPKGHYRDILIRTGLGLTSHPPSAFFHVRVNRMPGSRPTTPFNVEMMDDLGPVARRALRETARDLTGRLLVLCRYEAFIHRRPLACLTDVAESCSIGDFTSVLLRGFSLDHRQRNPDAMTE